LICDLIRRLFIKKLLDKMWLLIDCITGDDLDAGLQTFNQDVLGLPIG
jgi:hypothetical protein